MQIPGNAQAPLALAQLPGRLSETHVHVRFRQAPLGVTELAAWSCLPCLIRCRCQLSTRTAISIRRTAHSGLEPDEAIRLAAEVGVTRIVQIGCDPDGCRWAVAAAERWPSVIAGVAIHPNDAARMGPELVPALELVEGLAQHRRVRAVGRRDWITTGLAMPLGRRSRERHLRPISLSPRPTTRLWSSTIATPTTTL